MLPKDTDEWDEAIVVVAERLDPEMLAEALKARGVADAKGNPANPAAETEASAVVTLKKDDPERIIYRRWLE